MACWGSPWGSGWGEPENHFVYVIPDTAGMIASGYTYMPYRFKLRSGLDTNNPAVGIYRNAKFVRNVIINNQSEFKGAVDIPWGASSVSIMPFHLGQLYDPSFTEEVVARLFEKKENARITVPLTFVPKVFEPPLSDSGYTSNWSLTGLVQGVTTDLVQGETSWGKLQLDIVVAAGVVTVTLSRGGSSISSGSATVLGAPFTVTLTDSTSGGTGLTGTVTISNTVASVAAGVLHVIWPVSLQVLRGTVDPPTVVVATVKFTGINSVRYTESADLAAGTYYYRAQPVSDTGVTGTQTASKSLAPIIAPQPPTALVFTSGTCAGGLTLGFVSSLTGGATYRLYMATVIGQIMNLNAIQATAAANATSIVTPAITGQPGLIYCLVRAVLAGVEERNLNLLVLEALADGTVRAARPNTPTIRMPFAITSGRAITLVGVYNTDHEAVAATTLNMFVRTPSGAYTTNANGDYTGAVGSGGTLAANGVKGIKTGTITYTFPSDGYRYVKLLAVSAGSIQSNPADAQEVLVLPTNEALPAPSGFDVVLSRS